MDTLPQQQLIPPPSPPSSLRRLSKQAVEEGSGALQLVPTFSQCAATLSAAYLGWLSA